MKEWHQYYYCRQMDDSSNNPVEKLFKFTENNEIISTRVRKPGYNPCRECKYEWSIWISYVLMHKVSLTLVELAVFHVVWHPRREDKLREPWRVLHRLRRRVNLQMSLQCIHNYCSFCVCSISSKNTVFQIIVWPPYIRKKERINKIKEYRVIWCNSLYN